MLEQYFGTIRSLLADVEDQETVAIQRGSAMVADVIADGGVIHVFGSGHSHIMAEEVFHRAGGLMPVNAMLDPNLTHFGLLKAGLVERTEGYASAVFGSYDLRPEELLIVVSNSGINAVPIELAMEAAKAGIRVIAITSASNYVAVRSRHSSGMKLADVADHVIDSHVPLGDASVDLGGIRIGATSTVVGAAIMNALIVEAIAILHGRGIEPPVLVSMNIPGGEERNGVLETQYRERLQLLKGPWRG